MSDDDNEPVVLTPFGLLTKTEYFKKLEEAHVTSEANERAIFALFETLSRDDLHAVMCMLHCADSDRDLLHRFIGMGEMAKRIRFPDIEEAFTEGDGNDE